MFTGLVEEIGTVLAISASKEGAELAIGAKTVLSGLKIGDSIAVDGPCLSVTSFNQRGFSAFAMAETLKKTTLGELKAGDKVHLERALALGGRLGGHLVSGHIDTVVTVSGRRSQGSAVLLEISCPRELLAYIVPKGSVAINGVSLTVIETSPGGFSVGLIPQTLATTTLGALKIGAKINLEADLIGKYVENILQYRFGAPQEAAKKDDNITMNLLQEKGFL